MDEYRRLAYLEAMGVDSYFPIFRLPGAKPSERCALPAVAEEVAGRAADTVVDVATDSAPAEPQKRTAPNLGGLLESEGRSASKPAPTPEPEPAEEAPRFALRLIHTDCGFLLVDSLSETVSEKRLLRFVSNLLLAVTRQQDIRLSTAVFRWPMAENPLLDNGEAAAREALHAGITANIERHSVRWLILMGEPAAAYLDVDELAVAAVTLPAPVEVFRDPQRKRDIWEKLKVLVPEQS